MNFEDEMQENIESRAETSGKDAEAYRKVFAALKKEPALFLSDGFADNVIRRVRERRTRTSYGMEIAAWVVSVILVFVGGAYAVVTTNTSFNLGFLNGLKPYLGVFAFGVVGVFIFQYFEKRLLGKRIDPDPLE